ncbi:hypothetical protein GGS24DRAFT_517374 [Hypoxylon argillaceum]|nr:hypothetical protein GGS24DRAFT_517374 [Hypoxylon argillaceum]
MRLIFASLMLASLASVRSQDLNSTIVGCVEVGCPASTVSKTDDNCTVAGGSYSYVGLARVPTTQENLKGLSWTKGSGAALNQSFQTSFFLGTPPNLNLSNTGACSVFLHGVSKTLLFGGDSETSQGTCADAMGSACVDALLDRARSVFKGSNTNSTSSADLCSALQDDLEKNMDNACQSKSQGSWTNLTSTALTGNGSPQPISAKDNSTSTCWPVLPKQYELTHVTDHTVATSIYLQDIKAALFAITPVLTVFYPNGEGSVVSDIDASLTCLKVVGPERASLATMDDGSNGSAVSSSPTPTILVAAVALLVVFFMGG